MSEFGCYFTLKISSCIEMFGNRKKKKKRNVGSVPTTSVCVCHGQCVPSAIGHLASGTIWPKSLILLVGIGA